MREQEYKAVELRSEEVQEVMGKIPAWIVRWGITILFLVVLALVVGSCFFKYPDVIVTEMTMTGRYPVAQVVSRSSGKISKLYVTDGQEVSPNTLLAVIENPASTEDMAYLKGLVQRYSNNPDSLISAFFKPGEKELALGDVQATYGSFLTALHEYENYYALNYYPKKIAATRAQINKHRVNFRNQQRQQQVAEAQYQLAVQQYNRDSLLFVRGVVSPSEHETARTSYLQSRYALESGYIALENLQIQIGEMETTLLDMELQQAEKESVIIQNFRTNAEQLMNAIQGWELACCLLSPISGKVTFTKYWNENQFVPAGENVCTIVPDETEALIGKASLPIQRSGKVKTGQRVLIRFANFPDQEFGTVNGTVSAISLVPSENNYQVEITFPDGLRTNYRKTLPVTHEMKASAEIVTEDLRLIERFFLPLKRIWKEGF
ncbi:MAG: HlyD family secretion protein [Tannerella sp.]|jgi:HlyD family secretion protein|nr:HlyD family secretion protein [Tannerella sp.]